MMLLSACVSPTTNKTHTHTCVCCGMWCMSVCVHVCMLSWYVRCRTSGVNKAPPAVCAALALLGWHAFCIYVDVITTLLYIYQGVCKTAVTVVGKDNRESVIGMLTMLRNTAINLATYIPWGSTMNIHIP